MPARRKPANGVEVLNLDFDDQWWRRDIEMERLLDQEKMTFEYIKAPVEDFNTYFERSQVAGQEQIRSTGSVAAIVDQYKESILLGEKLPAGTVSDQNIPVDFYHRGKAAIAAAVPHFVLLRITTDIAPWQRSVIATLRNNMHGLRMTEPDTMAQALLCVEHGWTPEETARKFKIDVSTLRRALTIRQTTERAKRLGVETQFGTVKRTTQAELANAGLHDSPFKNLVSLLAENPVSTTKAADIIRDVKGQPSDRKANERIKEIKDDLAPKTLPVLGASPSGTTSSTTTVAKTNGGPVTFKGAAKAFLDGHPEAVFLDAPTVSGLLTGTPTDAAYPRIKKVLEEMREPFEKLIAHYS